MNFFLDTNIYIIGQLKVDSWEHRILEKVGFYDSSSVDQVVISQELINQILRVGKRLQGKDWAAKLVDQIWYNLNFIFVPETDEFKQEIKATFAAQKIPSEDVLIYVAAKFGQTDIFVSGNRELIQNIADFKCLNAQDFVQQFDESV